VIGEQLKVIKEREALARELTKSWRERMHLPTQVFVCSVLRHGQSSAAGTGTLWWEVFCRVGEEVIVKVPDDAVYIRMSLPLADICDRKAYHIQVKGGHTEARFVFRGLHRVSKLQ
jgi:hypothetical protein